MKLQKATNYTSIEQSKKLVELGLDPKTADMLYTYVLPPSDNIKHIPEIGEPTIALEWYNKGHTFFNKTPLTLEQYCVPCWSAGRLMELMCEGKPYYLETWFRGFQGNNIIDEWFCSYDNLDEESEPYSTHDKTLIGTYYKMMKWLLKNKKL